MDFSFFTSEFYFSFFYILSFLVPAILILLVGIKRNYDLKFLLLTLATITIFSIIGSRLFTIPIEEWTSIFNSSLSINYNGRSAIGALLFGLIALLISQKIICFKKPILDVYAFTAPIGLAIQKLGCFFIGCCYGNVTDSVFGVHYIKGTHAHFNHWVSNLIDDDALFSLSVHPVQLYETAGLFVIAYIVWSTRNFWKKNGSSLLFGIALLMFFRFSIEFVRDAAASPFNKYYLLGVRAFQWTLLSIGIISATFLIIYEKYLKINLFKVEKPYLNHNYSIHFIMVISLVIYAFQELFTIYEFGVILINIAPAIVVTAIFVYKNNLTLKKYLIGFTFLIFPFILISQSIPTEQGEVIKYKRVDIGTSFGSLVGDIAFNPTATECGTSYDHEYYKYKYTVGGVGFSQISNQEKATFTYGANLYGGSNKEINLTSGTEKSFFVYGVNPFASYNMKWIGAGGGFQLGNLRWFPLGASEAINFENGMKTATILPEFYLRVGRRDILDIKYAYGFSFPSPFPSQTQEFSIGSGFSLKEDYSLRYGFLQAPDAQFVSAEGLFNEKLGFKFSYIFNTEGFYGEKNSDTRLIFGLNYRFDFENNKK